MKKAITLDFDTFETRYKPIENTESQYYFETFGEELEMVLKYVDKNLVWTVVDEDEDLIIQNGYHLVNRYVYIICTVPYKDGEIINVDYI